MCVKSQLKVWGFDIGAGWWWGGGGRRGNRGFIDIDIEKCKNCSNVTGKGMILSSIINHFAIHCPVSTAVPCPPLCCVTTSPCLPLSSVRHVSVPPTDPWLRLFCFTTAPCQPLSCVHRCPCVAATQCLPLPFMPTTALCTVHHLPVRAHQ
jgi:hypothetical protein